MSEKTTSNIDRSFDENLNTVKGVSWLPWVGNKYAIAKSPRLLILGESNYDWGYGAQERLADPEFSRQLIATDKGLDVDSNQKFFRNIERLIYNKSIVAYEERCNFWLNTCYFNLVQRPMESNKHRPTVKDYNSGWYIALKIIDILKPTHCIVCGSNWYSYGALKLVATEGNLKNEKQISEKINGTYTRAITLNSSLLARVVFIKHPSHHSSWSRWGEFLQSEIPELEHCYS